MSPRDRGRGRPLRFVAMVVVGWTGLRIAMLWPAPLPAIAVAPRAARLEPMKPLRVAATPVARRQVWRSVASRRREDGPAHPPSPLSEATEASTRLDVPRAFLALPVLATEWAGLPAGQDGFDSPVWARLPQARRWLVSNWLVLRPGQGIGSAPTAGQLGGSQYGVRLRYGIGGGRHLAAYGRLAGPLRGRGVEAALGLEWQPAAAPVRVAIEQRVGLDGTRGGQGLGLVTGLDHRSLAGFRLEAYGQAGVILRARREPYADGAVRGTLPLAAHGRTLLTIGAGLWGAAQREAQRLDIGPTLVATLPIRQTGVRLALDWRQRVAGRARPGSGVALTLGSDF